MSILRTRGIFQTRKLSKWDQNLINSSFVKRTKRGHYKRKKVTADVLFRGKICVVFLVSACLERIRLCEVGFAERMSDGDVESDKPVAAREFELNVRIELVRFVVRRGGRRGRGVGRRRRERRERGRGRDDVTSFHTHRASNVDDGMNDGLVAIVDAVFLHGCASVMVVSVNGFFATQTAGGKIVLGRKMEDVADDEREGAVVVAFFVESVGEDAKEEASLVGAKMKKSYAKRKEGISGVVSTRCRVRSAELEYVRRGRRAVSVVGFESDVFVEEIVDVPGEKMLKFGFGRARR
jgi:hypothetical protein